MSIFALVLIAFAMSSDAFAASISKGVQLKSPRFINALKMGLIFGVIEGITPIIGWVIGSVGSAYVQEIDHWIAFTLLFLLGLHMVYVSFKEDEENEEGAPNLVSKKRALAATILTALGTSIDAMTVGVTFAFLEVNIFIAALLIGLATTLMVTIGALLGTSLGAIVGKRAEAFGGIILMLIGSWILYSHLSAAV
jgi:putative Mn2+ efflux pump MntP